MAQHLLPEEGRLFLDTVIDKGLLFLIVFTPLALGTVQQWSIAVMEVAAFILLILHLIRGLSAPQPSVFGSGLKVPAILFFCFLGVVCLQLLPLPHQLLGLISPVSLSLQERFGARGSTISLNPRATFEELLKLLAYAAVFVVVVGRLRSKEQIRSLSRVILYMACALAVLAVVQKLTWNGRMLWLYPVDDYIHSDASYIWGPYINHNHFAGYLEMAIPLGLGLLVYAAPSTGSLEGVPLNRRIGRFLSSGNLSSFTIIFVFVLISAATLLISLSRGGIAAFGISSLFFVFITGRRRSLKRRTGLLVLTAAALSTMILVASWDRLVNRFESLRSEQEVVRLRIWEETLPLVHEFSVVGSGLGTYEQAFMRHQKTLAHILFDHAHNDYLELLTDTGVAGLVFAAGGAVAFFVICLRAWSRRHGMFSKCMGAAGLSSLVAIAVHSVVDFNLHIPANALLLAVIAAITYASVFTLSSRRGEEEQPVSPTMSRRLIGYGAIALFACLPVFPMRDFASDYYYSRVNRMLDDPATEGLDTRPISQQTLPEYLGSIESLKKAQTLCPENGLYAKALSELYLRMGRWSEAMQAMGVELPAGALPPPFSFDEALRYAELAARLEPFNPDYHLGLARLHADLKGDTQKADEEVAKALDAYPRSAPLRNAAATFFLGQKRPGDAIEQARIAASIDDSYVLQDSSLKTAMKERRTDDYINVLFRSHLFAALDIVWRASADPLVVKGIVPDNSDAKDVLHAFAEWKGIE